MRGLKVTRCIFVSPGTHIVDHGSTPRPIDAAVQGCAVHMTMDPLALGHHGDCLYTVDVLSRHQLPMPLHMVHSAPWNRFPSR